MLRFVVDRIVRLILVLVAITILSFAFIHAIPGDPVALRLGEHASPQEVAHLRSSLGLDRPVWVQLALPCSSVALRSVVTRGLVAELRSRDGPDDVFLRRLLGVEVPGSLTEA